MTDAAGRSSITAFLALGFRPFYLLAAINAVLALPVWMAAYTGLMGWHAYLHSLSWHSHEMIFGFATTVMAGFLLTAVRNWTSQPTPSGAMLGMLAAVWLLARIMNLTGPAELAAPVDIAFLPLLGYTIAIPIFRSRNVRNIKLLLLLVLLTGANLVYHLSYADVLPADLIRVSLVIALDVFTILMAIVGGRVIPAFTANAVASAKPRTFKTVEVVALGSQVLIVAAGIAGYWYSLSAEQWTAVFAVAALAHAVRLWLWQPYRTIRNPLLLMLPVAYAWIPISLALRALTHSAGVPPAAATHALTVGAISGLMVAMMTRSALGHTGRKLIAGWAEKSAFTFVQLAAVVRVGATFVSPALYRHAVIASGVLWTLAFTAFLIRYWAILTRPRIDGLPG